MKKVFVFSGLDKFDILDYQRLYFWNTDFQSEVHIAEKKIGLGSFIQKSMMNLHFDSFYHDIEKSLLLFNISQVALAKGVERISGKPDLLLTHSLGEISAGIYNQSLGYDALWDFYKTTMPYCRQKSSLDYTNLMVFGDSEDLQKFIQSTQLSVMSQNSPTSALIWLGDRADIDKKMIKSFNLSSISVKLLSYPIHTSLMIEGSENALKDLYKNKIFEKYKSTKVNSLYPIVSSTKYKVIRPNECDSLEKISEIWTELCRTPMDLSKTYQILKAHYKNEPFTNYVLEHSNAFISAIRENDPEGLHHSGLLTSTQKKLSLFGCNLLIQDLGLYSKMGDSLSFLKK